MAFVVSSKEYKRNKILGKEEHTTTSLNLGKDFHADAKCFSLSDGGNLMAAERMGAGGESKKEGRVSGLELTARGVWGLKALFFACVLWDGDETLFYAF